MYHCEGLRITSFGTPESEQEANSRVRLECCHKVSCKPRHLSPSCCAFRFPRSFRKVLDEGG